MPSDFTYILATLPMLQLSGEGAPEYDAFLEGVKELLSADEYALLEGLELAPKTSDPQAEYEVLCSWTQWRTAMVDVLAQWRAKRYGKAEATAGMRLRSEYGAFPGDVRRLETILQAATMAERQEGWEALAWERLDSLTSPGQFDFQTLIAYALKLRLLELRRKRDAKAGQQAFEELVTARLAEAAEHRVSVEE